MEGGTGRLGVGAALLVRDPIVCPAEMGSLTALRTSRHPWSRKTRLQVLACADHLIPWIELKGQTSLGVSVIATPPPCGLDLVNKSWLPGGPELILPPSHTFIATLSHCILFIDIALKPFLDRSSNAKHLPKNTNKVAF